MNASPRYLIWPVDYENGRPIGYVVRDTVRNHEVVTAALSRADAQAEARRLNGTDEVTIPRVKGAKWLREATYINNDVKREVVKTIEELRNAYPGEPIMIRPASHIGEASGLVTVCFGAGQRIYRVI